MCMLVYACNFVCAAIRRKNNRYYASIVTLNLNSISQLRETVRKVDDLPEVTLDDDEAKLSVAPAASPESDLDHTQQHSIARALFGV